MKPITADSPATPVADADVAPPGQAPVQQPATGPRPGGRDGPLRSGNPRGNPNLAPRCGAKARTTGCACRAPAMPNGRCRLHGGKSTGPRTPKGLAKLARVNTTHGKYAQAGHGAKLRVADRQMRVLLRRTRVSMAADRLLRWLPRAFAERLLAYDAPELQAPRNYRWLLDPPVAASPAPDVPAQVPGKPRRDARGRFAAPPRPALRGRQAELAQARAEVEALAPWRAATRRAGMIKRVMRAQAQRERRERLGQEAVRSLPPDACPGASVGAGPGDGIGAAAHEPHITWCGDGTDAAKPAAHGAAGDGGMAAASPSAAAVAGPGVGMSLHEPHVEPATGHLSRWLRGDGTDAARRAARGATGDVGPAAAGLGGAAAEGPAIGRSAHGPHITWRGAGTGAAKGVGRAASGAIGRIPAGPSATAAGRPGFGTPAHEPYVTWHGGRTGAGTRGRDGAAGRAEMASAGPGGTAAQGPGFGAAVQGPPVTPAAGHLTRWWCGGDGAGPQPIIATGPAMEERHRQEQARLRGGAFWPAGGGLRARLLGSSSLDEGAAGVMVRGGIPALIEALGAGRGAWAAIARLLA